jgi:amidase
MASSPLDLPVTEQARLVARGDVSSLELVNEALARIEAQNPQLQAFVTHWPVRARLAARQRDLQRALGQPLGPFHGVPLGIKDLNFVRGAPTRFGSRGSLPYPAPVDDLTVRPLRRAGFVFLGKTAASELGAMPVTEPDLHPPTRNPWNPEHTPGGSSGGSAAAVSGGLLPAAHASDGGGSIRIPASFTGLVGLKPGRGRIPNAFGYDDHRILYTTGALTRTVGDSAALLDVMSGLAFGAPHWAPPPPAPYALLVERPPRALRLRLTLDSPLGPIDPEVRAATEAMARRLEALGHHVELHGPPAVEVAEFLPLWQQLISTVPLIRWRRTQPLTRWLAEAGKRLDLAEVKALHQRLEARVMAWFGDLDGWLTPTVPVLPPRIGAFPRDAEPRETFAAIAQLAAFTAVANLTGLPSLSLPAAQSTGGLPIGVMITGRPHDELTLLQLGRQVEQAHPWPLRAPSELRGPAVAPAASEGRCDGRQVIIWPKGTVS